MHKRATSAQGETTPDSEVPGGKRSKWYSLDEEVQKSSTIVALESPERASDALLALGGTAQDASKEACASLEDGIPVGGPPSTDKVVGEAPSIETVVSLPLQAR